MTLSALPYPVSASAMTGSVVASTICSSRAAISAKLSRPMSGLPKVPSMA
jgi:hypothetical protein